VNRLNPILFALYRGALRVYPSRLRLLYQDHMLQTVRDADSERSYSALYFWLYLFADLAKSSAKERLLMIRQQILTRPIFFHAVLLGLVLTLMGGGAAVTMQQMLRRGADHPQVEMASRYVHDIVDYRIIPSSVIPHVSVDPASSLEPFVILYDSSGNRLRSSAGYGLPDPPAGVFAYLRTHPSDEFTWQPHPGLRIAAIGQRIDIPTGFDLNPNPGFILVGRSLALVQQQEDLLRSGTFITWFVLMGLLALGALFLDRAQTRQALIA
jgi:hypothetical protein